MHKIVRMASSMGVSKFKTRNVFGILVMTRLMTHSSLRNPCFIDFYFLFIVQEKRVKKGDFETFFRNNIKMLWSFILTADFTAKIV